MGLGKTGPFFANCFSNFSCVVSLDLNVGGPWHFDGVWCDVRVLLNVSCSWCLPKLQGQVKVPTSDCFIFLITVLRAVYPVVSRGATGCRAGHLHVELLEHLSLSLWTVNSAYLYCVCVCARFLFYTTQLWNAHGWFWLQSLHFLTHFCLLFLWHV